MYHYSWFFLIPGVEEGTFLEGIVSDAERTGAHSILGAWLVFAVVLVFSLMANSGIKAARAAGGLEQYVPVTGLGARNLAELMVEWLFGLCDGIINNRRVTTQYFPVLAGIFIYVLISNLMGLVPGFLPPTSTISNNFAMAIVVFLVFNFAGLKENGWGYIKHLAGPGGAIGAFIFVVETFSLFLRPVTLSVRLFLNMFCDHLIFGVFSDLVPIVVPSFFLGLGTFVCFVQAFVFTLLTTVYISLGTAHSDHDHH